MEVSERLRRLTCVLAYDPREVGWTREAGQAGDFSESALRRRGAQKRKRDVQPRSQEFGRKSRFRRRERLVQRPRRNVQARGYVGGAQSRRIAAFTNAVEDGAQQIGRRMLVGCTGDKCQCRAELVHQNGVWQRGGGDKLRRQPAQHRRQHAAPAGVAPDAAPADRPGIGQPGLDPALRALEDDAGEALRRMGLVHPFTHHHDVTGLELLVAAVVRKGPGRAQRQEQVVTALGAAVDVLPGAARMVRADLFRHGRKASEWRPAQLDAEVFGHVTPVRDLPQGLPHDIHPVVEAHAVRDALRGELLMQIRDGERSLWRWLSGQCRLAACCRSPSARCSHGECHLDRRALGARRQSRSSLQGVRCLARTANLLRSVQPPCRRQDSGSAIPRSPS